MPPAFCQHLKLTTVDIVDLVDLVDMEEFGQANSIRLTNRMQVFPSHTSLFTKG